MSELVWLYYKFISDDVTQAVGTNFSVTLVSACRPNQPYGCEIKYVLTAVGSSNPLSITVTNDGFPTGNYTEYGVTLYYAYVINNQRAVIFNLTIVSNALPVTVHLRSQYQRDCAGTQSIAWLSFKGDVSISMDFLNDYHCWNPLTTRI